MDRLINNKIHITNRSNYVPKLSNMGQNLPKNGTVKVRKVLGENINFSAYPGQKRDKKSEKIGFLKTQIISNQIVGKIKNAAEYLALSAKTRETVIYLRFRSFNVAEPGQKRDSKYKRSFPTKKMERNKKNV